MPDPKTPMTATEIEAGWRDWEERVQAAEAKVLKPLIEKELEILAKHGLLPPERKV